MSYDLIVVGCGSVGTAAGFYATQAGLSVLMIDSGHPLHSEGTHHGETRLIRHTYGEGERIMHCSGIINLAPMQSDFYPQRD
ncbi:N-methyl-L-tryptophan oxidase|nr:N-methyl-L-tryptophan oxidase [Candidatus Pantoea persica]